VEELFGSKKFISAFSSPLRTTDSAFLDKMFSSKRPSKKPGMSLSARICSEGKEKDERGREKQDVRERKGSRGEGRERG
jgi:hypothetical protein